MNQHTAKLLEQHFDTAFAAPGGIKKLRELILTLAMQGKLVPQDPNDPPASELLKDIETEKQRLVKEGKIKKPKPLPPVTEAEQPYALPQGWEWVRLGNAMLKVTDGTHHSPPNHQVGDFLYISAKNIKEDGVLLSNATFVDKNVHEEIYARCDPEYGNILYIKDGATTGVVTVNDLHEQFSMLSSVALLKQPTRINNRFLLFTLRSPFFYEEMRAGMTGVAITRVTLNKLNVAIIPLPPSQEQHRIVAKIDELMARCDELEQLRSAQQDKRLSVHTAAVQQLLNIAEPQQHQRAQQFIAEHFGELYTVKENVAELRKAILQLAVMGKLVPQDPNDQPASELLKEIEAEKQRLVKEGKLKKPKPLPPMTEAEQPYALPQGWEWTQMGNIAISSDSGWSPQCNAEPRSGEQWGVLKVSAVSWGTFNAAENKALPSSQKPRPECEVKDGDFLISRANTDELVARSVIVQEAPIHLMMSDKIVRFNLSAHVNKIFINRVNGASHSRNYYAGNASGTSSSMKNVSREVMALLPIPLPPLPEQHCIVAKIDQLMALCDTLDQQIDAATAKQTELLNAVMAQV